MSGLNGVRQLMALYAPLLTALLAVTLARIHAGPAVSVRDVLRTHPQELRMLGSALLFTACSAAGYLVNMTVLQQNHSFASYGTLRWGDSPLSVLTVFRDFLLLFGYQSGQPLFSFTGIASGLGLLLGLAVLASLVRLGLRFARLELRHQVVAAFTLGGLLIQALVLCYLGPYEPNYWLPFLPFGLAALVLAVQTGPFRLRGARQVTALVLAACLSVCSVATVQEELARPFRGKPGLDTVVDWLRDRGYSSGYALFWTSQAVAELSDGEIEMWTIQNANGTLYPWLQPIDHLDRMPETPCFLLLDLGLLESPEAFAGGTEVYRDDRFVVLESDDPAAFFPPAEGTDASS